MQRVAEKSLVKWLKSKRRKPLLLRGARQVGKSTLVRNFAANNDMKLNEINLERHRALETVFATLDISIIRNELEGIVNRSLTAPGSLLFLDEIQATPSAIQALRYFYEELPEVPVISAGSLVEFTLADHPFPMPVGRIEYFHLGPMTFSEFLVEIEPELYEALERLSLDDLPPNTLHQRLMTRLRQYMFTGGMPESVLAYSETGSLVETTPVHRSIVTTYEDDFAKYARQSDLMLLQGIFRRIPIQVGKKVKYSQFSRESRSRQVKAMIDLLVKARVCYRVNASHCQGLPLNASIDEMVFKLLFMDVGLMNHICGVRWRDINGLDNVRLVNEGAIAEQFIGQHLVFNNAGLEPPETTYWLRENRSGNAEVDYVIAIDRAIVPVEVKAGRSGRLRSLHQFALFRDTRIALRFDANPPGQQAVEVEVQRGNQRHLVKYQLVSLPLYAVEMRERFSGSR